MDRAEVMALERAEVDLDHGANVDGNALIRSGLEGPLLDGCDGLFVEAHPQGFHDLNVGCFAIGPHDDGERDGAAVFRSSRLFGELRVDLDEQFGRIDLFRATEGIRGRG